MQGMAGERDIDLVNTRQIRILYIVNVMCIGGTELFLLRKIKQLRERGHFAALAYVEERGSEIHSLLKLHLDDKEVYRASYQFDEIVDLVRSLEINVLHAVQAHPFFIRSAKKQIPELICISTVTANVWEADQKFDHQRYTDAIVTKSEGFRDIISEKLAKPPKEIVSIPNGVDLGEFNSKKVPNELRAGKLKELGIPENSKIVLHVSRIVPFKNIEFSLEIAKKLIKEDEQIYFLHLGGFPESQEDYYRSLVKFVEEHGLENRYLFLGEEKNVRLFLALSKIFLLTTKTHEGTPNALLEALSMGKPIVAFDCRGIKDLVLDGQTGFRVQIDNIEEAASRIKMLLEHLTLYKTLSEQCVSFVRENFSIDQAVDSYEDLYRRYVFP